MKWQTERGKEFGNDESFKCIKSNCATNLYLGR